MALELNSNSVEYKNNQVIIKNIPKNGDNLSVFIRPGDEVIFQLKGIDSDALEYTLIGGDIVVSFPGEGAFTFASLGLMSFSNNPPQFNFGAGKIISVDNILSKIEEVNELPIDSVNASFKMRVSNINEETGLTHNKTDEVPAPPVIIVPQSQPLEDVNEKKEAFLAMYDENRKSYENQIDVNTNNAFVTSTYTKPYSHYTQPNDFNAYKPDVEMIPKPDVEMIPKPDVEMIPKNDFTDYFPENDFTDYYPDPDDGSGNGNVSEAAKPAFYFKATAHQVRYSEILNEDNVAEILGGGGSINGYKFDSITNQFEPETIDMSSRTENMVIKAENTTYFSDAPTSVTGVNNITFKDLIAGQSVTVDGLTLTASGTILAADVAAAFDNLVASSDGTGVVVTNGTWSGVLSEGWSSGAVSGSTVAFTSTIANTDISTFSITSAGATIAAPTPVNIVSIQGVDNTTTETHTLSFQDLIAGQSVTVEGLTLTATGAISAADIATAFGNLAASADGTGITVTNGEWSGALSTGWSSGAASTSAVTFTSTALIANADVSDIVVSSAGSTTIAPDAVDNVATQETADVYLSRVLRFEPQMPEGFYIESFSLSGLPSDVTILDKNGNPIVGSVVTRDQMIFKDALGEVIDYSSADFLTNFKSTEFVIKYVNTITDPFNVSITANYKLDASYASTTDIGPEQSYTNDYTFALKDITAASDYTYNRVDFANGQNEGFILAKEANYNIIKDGSGNDIIYGGIVKDVVYDGKGDDTIYLSSGNDTLYGGSGTNYIYGDTNNDSANSTKYAGSDTVSYEQIQSFSTSEVEVLSDKGLISLEDGQKLSGTSGSSAIDVDMLTSYKGVYVDLDGVYIDGLNIDVNGDEIIDSSDTINAISKFANRVDKFTYDENGYAINTSLDKSITFSSTTLATDVPDLVVTSAGTTAVIAPTPVNIVSIQGVDNTTTETHTLSFQDLIAGQSVTVEGLTLTATGAISAADIATAFGNLAASADGTGITVTNGEWSGALSTGWSSGAASTSAVTFTSTALIANADVSDIVVSSAGTTAVDAPNSVISEIVQGNNQSDTRQTEQASLVFQDLIAGQSVTVDGLTLTAIGAISAAEVAAGFASTTNGNAVANGVWSGTLANWTAGDLDQTGLENLQAIGYDIYDEVENIIGSNYADTIYGNAAKNNILSGLNGSDTIDGRGGDNTLLGGDGFDTLIAGSGKDSIDGGADTDTVSYVNMTEGIILRFDRPNAEEYDYSGRFDGGGNFVIKDTIINVEDSIGTDFADIIYGNANTNFIQAGAGDDKIYAGNGYDFLDGGGGSDWITYKPTDYINLSTNPNFMQDIQGITVDLNSTDFVMVKETATNSLIDLVKSVEQISATDGIDKIYGGNAAEIFWGHGGNDTLWGRGGNDTLWGGTGDDYIRPGSGNDNSHGDTGVDFLELYDDGLKSKTEQVLRLSATGTVQYSTDTTDGSNGSWSDGYKTGSGIGIVELADGFEGIGGSYGADIIYGNDVANILNGNQGDDELYGLTGNDTLRGGDGFDILVGGGGNDIIYGDRNNDTIDAGDGDDIVYGYGRYDTNIENKDTIDGGDGTDTLNYSSTNNAFVLNLNVTDGSGYSIVSFEASNSGNNKYNDLVKNFETIIGSTGNDTVTANNSGMILDGWSGKDFLYGGNGNDTIIARNTSGEILDGGGGTDALTLSQNVDFRNITVRHFETLDLGNYTAYYNIGQFFTDNAFTTITGGDNSRINLYGTANISDTFDFSTVDFSGFTGILYVYGNSGNDTYDFSGATLNSNMKYYLDASGGTDTLVMGEAQAISMPYNYYNSFEDFNIGAGSNLNINASSNGTTTWSADTKNFDDVDGQINLIGGTGNDTFYANYEALLAGKLTIDGGNGSDLVDIRTTTTTGLTFNDSNMFDNIERLEVDTVSAANTITMDANDIVEWKSGDLFTLDLANNNSQANQVHIINTQAAGGDMTNFTISSSDYTIAPIGDDSFALHVV